MGLCKTLSLHIHTNFGSCQSLSFSVFFFVLFSSFLPKMPSFNELQKLRSERESKDHPTSSSVYSYRKKKERKKRTMQLFMSDPSHLICSPVCTLTPSKSFCASKKFCTRSFICLYENQSQSLIKEGQSEPAPTPRHHHHPRWMDELMDGWMNE